MFCSSVGFVGRFSACALASLAVFASSFRFVGSFFLECFLRWPFVGFGFGFVSRLLLNVDLNISLNVVSYVELYICLGFELHVELNIGVNAEMHVEFTIELNGELHVELNALLNVELHIQLFVELNMEWNADMCIK